MRRLSLLVCVVAMIVASVGCAVGESVFDQGDASPARDVFRDSHISRDAQTLSAGRTYMTLRNCVGCHESADLADGILTGSPTPIPGSARGVLAFPSNLTPDPSTGLGEWSDREILDAIRKGVNRRGEAMCVMPVYREMPDDEGAAIVAYLRTLRPVPRSIEPSVCLGERGEEIGGADSPDDAAVRDGGSITVATHGSDASACDARLVINEVQTTGSTSAADEFVEIYNASPCTASLAGYELRYASTTGTTASRRWVGAVGDTIVPSGTVVIAGAAFSADAGITGRFASPSGTLGAAGSMGLFDPSGTRIDSVGWGPSATGFLTERAPAASPPAGQSISRVPDAIDTDDNSADFVVTPTPTPIAANWR